MALLDYNNNNKYALISVSRKVAGPLSQSPVMLHHMSTVAQKGQTNHWL